MKCCKFDFGFKSRRKDIPVRNFRNFNLVANMFAIIYFSVNPITNLHRSFISSTPYYFIIVIMIYSIQCFYYSTVCKITSWVTSCPDNKEGLFFCKRCNMYIPCRASHCKTCDRCVLRRDHHCPWTGCCIGQKNHFFFIFYVILQGTYAIILFIDMCKSIYRIQNRLNYLIHHPDMVILGFFIVFTMTATIPLLISQIQLILVNYTTFEYSLMYKVSYLRKYPPGANPFNYGFKENIKEFIEMTHKDITWEVPPPPEEIGWHFTKDDFAPQYFEYLKEVEESERKQPIADQTTQA